MPVYNGERWINDSILSIVNQPNDSYELIIINDGSTDNSKEIIEELSNRHDTIVFIDSDNGGVGHARNIGIKQAKGKYILFVDQDDFIFDGVFDDQFVETLKKAYVQNTDLYVTKDVVANESHNRYFTHNNGIQSSYEDDSKMTVYGISSVIPIHSCFFSTRVLIENNIRFFDQYRNTDTDLQVCHLIFYYSKKIEFNNDLKIYCWVNNLQSASHNNQRASNSCYEALLCWRDIIELHRNINKDENALHYCISCLCGTYYYYLIDYYCGIRRLAINDKVINDFDNYVFENYKEHAWGKPRNELDFYYRHKLVFKLKMVIKNFIKKNARRIKNGIPIVRKRYEIQKFPLSISEL